jgi:hypothetical protein
MDCGGGKKSFEATMAFWKAYKQTPHVICSTLTRIQGEGEKINKLDGPKLISSLGAIRPITDSGQARINRLSLAQVGFF